MYNNNEESKGASFMINNIINNYDKLSPSDHVSSNRTQQATNAVSSQEKVGPNNMLQDYTYSHNGESSSYPIYQQHYSQYPSASGSNNNIYNNYKSSPFDPGICQPTNNNNNTTYTPTAFGAHAQQSAIQDSNAFQFISYSNNIMNNSHNVNESGCESSYNNHYYYPLSTNTENPQICTSTCTSTASNTGANNNNISSYEDPTSSSFSSPYQTTIEEPKCSSHQQMYQHNIVPSQEMVGVAGNHYNNNSSPGSYNPYNFSNYPYSSYNMQSPMNGPGTLNASYTQQVSNEFNNNNYNNNLASEFNAPTVATYSPSCLNTGELPNSDFGTHNVSASPQMLDVVNNNISTNNSYNNINNNVKLPEFQHAFPAYYIGESTSAYPGFSNELNLTGITSDINNPGTNYNNPVNNNDGSIVLTRVYEEKSSNISQIINAQNNNMTAPTTGNCDDLMKQYYTENTEDPSTSEICFQVSKANNNNNVNNNTEIINTTITIDESNIKKKYNASEKKSRTEKLMAMKKAFEETPFAAKLLKSMSPIPKTSVFSSTRSVNLDLKMKMDKMVASCVDQTKEQPIEVQVKLAAHNKQILDDLELHSAFEFHWQPEQPLTDYYETKVKAFFKHNPLTNIPLKDISDRPRYFHSIKSRFSVPWLALLYSMNATISLGTRMENGILVWLKEPDAKMRNSYLQAIPVALDGVYREFHHYRVETEDEWKSGVSTINQCPSHDDFLLFKNISCVHLHLGRALLGLHPSISSDRFKSIFRSIHNEYKPVESYANKVPLGIMPVDKRMKDELIFIQSELKPIVVSDPNFAQQLMYQEISRGDRAPNTYGHTDPEEQKCKNCLLQSRNYEDHMKHLQDFTSISNVDGIRTVNYLCPSSSVVRNGIMCTTCFSVLSTKQSLNNHMIGHDPNRPVFHCTSCSFSTTIPDYMRVHEATHSTNHKWKCEHEDCTESFIREGLLKAHIMKVHLNFKKFICELCTKTFPTSYKLKRHIQSHIKRKEDELKNTCSVCSKVCSSQQNLSTHMKTHSNKPTCTICSKTLSKNSSLKEHMKTHDENRPRIKCTVGTCPQTFTRARSLEAHMKNHHKTT